MRTTIFDVAKQSLDLKTESKRIVRLFQQEKVITVYFDRFTLYEYCSRYCFKNWPGRNHFIDLEDFSNSIGIDAVINEALSGKMAYFIVLAEYALNLDYMAAHYGKNHSDCTVDEKYQLLHKVLIDDIESLSYQTRIIDGLVYVVEKDMPATVAVDCVEQNLESDIIMYKHHSLKGDLQNKKTILLRMGNELEPKRKSLEKAYYKLADVVFFLLNSLNIRHNNIADNPENNNFKRAVAEMSDQELEEQYDNLYHMMLLALIVVDNETRVRQAENLKNIITGGKHGQA